MTLPHAARIEPTPFSVENQRLKKSVPDKIPRGGWALKRFFADLLVDCARESGLLHTLQSVRPAPSKPSRGRTLIYSNESLLKASALRLTEKYSHAKDYVQFLQNNRHARQICGFEANRTPSEATLSRFASLLSKHRDAFWDTLTTVNRYINTFVTTGRETRGLDDDTPLFGEVLAIDSTDIESASDTNRRRHIDPSTPRPQRSRDCVSTLPRCCKPLDWQGADGKRTDRKHPEGISGYYGYKLHTICDAHYGTPLYAILTPANEYDGNWLRPLVEKTLKRYPWLAPKYILADKAYDSHANFTFLDSIGITAIIAVRDPRKRKDKKRATHKAEVDGPYGVYEQAFNAQGYPICPCNRVMRYIGTDTERGHLFECLQDRKRETRIPSALSCGDELWLKAEGKLLKFMGKIPRFSKKWSDLYKLRQTIERFFGSVKRSRLLNKQMYISMEKVAIHAQTSLLTYSVTMLARLMGGDYRRIRHMRM